MANWLKIRAGSGLHGRALRGTAIVAVGYAVSLGLRLATNLILTRLLFPEAFGLMALVSMVLVGLAMFSDLGLAPAIAGSSRGDDPRFLNTAWTIQVVRGGLLWLVVCALAWPLAQLYAVPDLVQILPVAGLTLVIAGLTTNRIETAQRHLALGRVTLIDLVAQLVSVAAVVAMALATGSVWALVLGALVSQAVRAVLASIWLPGLRNRLDWDHASGAELVRFGGWILLSTAFAFLLTQGDKAILGRSLTLESLGIYNIGFFLASFPMLLSGAVVGRVFIPLYRNVREDGSEAAFARMLRMRWLVTGVVVALLGTLALCGNALVWLLFDARYALAGGVVVAMACVQLPQSLIATYDAAALANGDSRGMSMVTAIRAISQTLLFLLGVYLAGLPGALAGQALAGVIALPFSIRLARRHGLHDPRHDAVFGVISVIFAGLALWLSSDALAGLAKL